MSYMFDASGDGDGGSVSKPATAFQAETTALGFSLRRMNERAAL